MSLSKIIIYQSVQDVAAAVKAGAELNVLDEYGYTPLVQTAIVNDVNKAKVLLDAGADPNFTDLTGRTALHWAADNNNFELCSLLLTKKANPNAYTLAGQPVLAMPLLREQTKLKHLLYQHGADLHFAQDFIEAKLLGHRYELHGHADVVNNENVLVEIDFAGFYLEFTLAMITNSLKRFTNNFANRKLHEYFSKVKQVVKHYDTACQLLNFQPYYIDKEQYATEISKLLTTKKEHELLMLPVAYKGHAISLVKYGNFLAHCDRGEYGRERGSSVVIYYLPDPHLFNEEFAKKLLYTRVDKEFIEHDMQRILMLEPQVYFNLPYQTIGNCSWSNVEAALPVMLFFLRLHEMYETNQAAPLPIDGTHVSQAREFAMLFYDKWKIWDRYSALQQCIDTFYSTSNQRQLTKASILAAILFQRSDENDPYYYESTRKVLSILSKPEFSYILKTYLKNFYHTNPTAIGKKLAELLDEFGVDINGHE